MHAMRRWPGLLFALTLVAPRTSQAGVVANEFYDLDDTAAPIEPPPGWTANGSGARSGIQITTAGTARYYTRTDLDMSNGQAWLIETVIFGTALGGVGEHGARMWALFNDPTIVDTLPPLGVPKFRMVELRLMEGTASSRRMALFSGTNGAELASLGLDWASVSPLFRVRLKRQQLGGVDYILLQAEPSRSGPLLTDPLNWDDPTDPNPDPDTANSVKVPLSSFGFTAGVINQFGFGHPNIGTIESFWEYIHVAVADDATTSFPYWPSVPPAPTLAFGGSGAPGTANVDYDIDLGPPGAYLTNDTARLELDSGAIRDVRDTVDPSHANGGLLHEDFDGLASGQTVTGSATVEDASGRPRVGPASLLDLLEAQLSITKTNNSNEVVSGSTASYILTVINSGPSTAAGARVQDTFPPGLAACSWTCSPGPGTFCNGAGSGNLDELVTLSAGASMSFAATCSVVATVGTVSNTATVTAPATVVDDAGDNTSTDDDVVSVPMFTDGFESGDTSAWSIARPALLLETTELETPVDAYWGAFEIDTSALARFQGAGPLVVGRGRREGGSASSGNVEKLFALEIRKTPAGFELRLHARLDDATWKRSPWVAVPRHARWIELRWRRALAELDDGEVVLHVDGDLRASLRELRNASAPLTVVSTAKDPRGAILLRKLGTR